MGPKTRNACVTHPTRWTAYLPPVETLACHVYNTPYPRVGEYINTTYLLVWVCKRGVLGGGLLGRPSRIHIPVAHKMEKA